MSSMGYGGNPMEALAQAAQTRQMQPATDLYWPENPGITPSPGFGSDPRFLGPPIHTSPHQPPGGGGGGPGFLGPPQQQPPGQGQEPNNGFGFQLPHPPPPDLYAIGRHYAKQRQQNVMDPTRAAAIQEMGKYLQQYGKLHEHHASLQEALHGMNKPQGR